MSFEKIIAILFVVLSCCACEKAPYSTAYNLDFEYAEQSVKPIRWGIPDAVFHGYDTRLDSDQRQHGKLSLCMTQTDSTKSGWAIFYQQLPIAITTGQEIELQGWIRTQDVQSGFADFYIAAPCQLDYDMLTLDIAERGVRNTADWTRVNVRKQIKTDMPQVEIGGILRGDGTAWFDNMELTINDQKISDTIIPAPKLQLTRKDKKELRKYVYPLHTFDPSDTDSTNLKVLDKLVGDSKVVALGENSHGSHEIFRMKDRLVRYLAEHNGFDIFSIEAYMPESYRFNDYIQKNQGNARSTVLQQQFWIWKTQEMVDMVSWMHDFNRSGRKIIYTGLDMQSYEGSIVVLKESFAHNKLVMDCIDAIDLGLTNVLSYSSIGAPIIDPIIANELTSNLVQLKNYISKSAAADRDKEWLLQNTNLLQQYIRQGPDTWRDRCMADNLLWIKSQNSSSRIVVWAHNGHVEKCRGKMGDFLVDSLGTDYVSIGFSFFNGNYTAVRRGSNQYVHEAQTAYPGTLEYLLEQLDEPFLILDLTRIKADNSQILAWIDALRFRHVGAVKIDDEFIDGGITDKFDYLIFIRNTSPSHLL